MCRLPDKINVDKRNSSRLLFVMVRSHCEKGQLHYPETDDRPKGYMIKVRQGEQKKEKFKVADKVDGSKHNLSIKNTTVFTY